MNDLPLLLIFLCGVFFTSAIAGWTCAFVQARKAENARHEACLLQHVNITNTHAFRQLQSENAALRARLNEIHPDDDEDWKHSEN